VRLGKLLEVAADHPERAFCDLPAILGLEGGDRPLQVRCKWLFKAPFSGVGI
jgi:hypothetical protein